MGQPAQQQEVPGIQSKMTPVPDCGEEKLSGQRKAHRQDRRDHWW